jgi:hypothetical protein
MELSPLNMDITDKKSIPSRVTDKEVKYTRRTEGAGCENQTTTNKGQKPGEGPFPGKARRVQDPYASSRLG